MGSISVDAASLATRLEGLIDEVQKNSESLKEDDRQRLFDATKRLSWALETPGDTVYRVIHGHLQLAMAFIGVDTKLFDILSKTDGTATIAELAGKTKMDPALLKRLLRFYQAFGFISQRGDDAYGATNITRAMTTPIAECAPRQFMEVFIPAYGALPQFLKETNYADVTDNKYIPWNIGRNTDKNFWQWMEEHPAQMDGFLTMMRTHRLGLSTPFDVLDFEQELAQGATDSTPLFVDIGGAMGHQCVALKKRYPGIPGRIILQEQEEVVERVKKSPLPGWDGMEAQAQSMWEPQTLKGARGYYLRNILHDYPDHKAIEILRNVRVGMTSESKVLIDEMVVPERGASWRVAGHDLIMLTCFAARERTQAEWASILDQAGLKILKLSEYAKVTCDSIIVAVLK
ncbi:S-adenosyl-L-methionine-dependent methyltransferase [Hypoxylon trugodes]|uniref:S-adenosyl-L-methionine-dependent methyltransferase n=1 Tax=Hypoxylon trugodes TaxID=326681 RepID=UPI0021965FAB|nr:S-adenosyl-L-methionine-dependent methyltransferase [Hypoxylon trugodes]KAI1387835.1 S-adenosyl-L-methionine-dependent methyltransferase [Hypoxylon trugodes]